MICGNSHIRTERLQKENAEEARDLEVGCTMNGIAGLMLVWGLGLCFISSLGLCKGMRDYMADAEFGGLGLRFIQV